MERNSKTWYQLVVAGLIFCLPVVANAETKEEEMKRLQHMLNMRTLGLEQPAPPPPPPPVVAPAVTVEASPAAPAELPKAEVDTSSDAPPMVYFTDFRLAGVAFGMEENALLAHLKAEGFACNMAQAQAAMRMLGRTMCVYPSAEVPKILMYTLRNTKLRDFELHETYKTNFPQEIYKRAKKKFMDNYSSYALCKAKRKGESCEVFGHGYRIVLRVEYDDDEAKIIRSAHTL